jgi:P4 family phage/plasmid primase-like protien
MNKTLSDYLSEFKSDSNRIFTHVSMISPNCRYVIDGDNIDKFMDTYASLLLKHKENFIAGIAERYQDCLPILVDVDISFENDGNIDISRKLYSDNEIKKLVQIYNKTLKSIIKNVKDQDLVAFVLEKPHPVIVGSKIKGAGFHIHYPRIWLKKEDHEVHLIPRIIERVKQEKIFDTLKIPIQDKSELIDKTYVSKCWLMYGSRKDPSQFPYSLTKIYNSKLEDIKLTAAMNNYNLVDVDGQPINIDEDIVYYLPRILSINSQYKEIYQLSNELECISKKDVPRIMDKKIFNKHTVEENLKDGAELLQIISPVRADNYDTWLDLGFILWNIGDGCNEALELWIDFSSTTSRDNFSETACVHQWKHMHKGDKGMGSLRFYAKQDNPDEYKKWNQKKQNTKINKSLEGGHNDIAKVLYEKYRDQYVCANISKKVWFEFDNHRWRRIENGIELRKKISDELPEMFEKQKKQMIEELNENDNDDQITKVRKLFAKMISNLKCATFKNNVMKECEEVFYNGEFLNRLDKNPYLICFENGVYDLAKGIFREGRPDDYLTMSTKYDYKDFKDDDIEISEVHDFVSKIFPTRELKDFFIRSSAIELQGGNINKTFIVMSGVGDNGKSITIELKELAYGDYAIKLPTSLITGKRTQSSGATPELDRINGVRFAVLQEPDSKDVINIGMLKELTGNDSMYVRGLYSTGRDIKPMFKLVLVCNKLPRLPCDDPATWNRIRVMEFQSRFPKNAKEVPKIYEEQVKAKIFPRDEHFSEKLPYMKQAFMWILMQEYKKISKERVRKPDPDIVMQATMIYRENNDIFYQFVNEKFVVDKKDKEEIKLSQVYEVFKSWFRDSFPNLKVPTKNELKEDLSIRWKEHMLKNGSFKSIREKSLYEKEDDKDDEDEEEEDVDAEIDDLLNDEE